MITVERVSPQNWSMISEHAHLVCFGTHKPKEWDRIDYALVARDENKNLLGYVTVRELDAQTAYWQFGGAFSGAKDTIKAFRVYESFVSWASERYTRVSTYIENTNTVMMKMAMKVGYRIVGLRTFENSILLEHLLEFNGGN